MSDLDDALAIENQQTQEPVSDLDAALAVDEEQSIIPVVATAEIPKTYPAPKAKVVPTPTIQQSQGFGNVGIARLTQAEKDAFVNSLVEEENKKWQSLDPIKGALVQPKDVSMEDKKEILKRVGSLESGSTFETVMSPFSKAMEESTKGRGFFKAFPKAVSGLIEGVKDVFSGKPGNEPITSDELESSKTLTKNPDGTWNLNLKNGMRMHIPPQEVIRANIQNVLEAAGKESDPDSVEKILSAIQWRGTLARDKATTAQEAISIMDVATFGVGSALLVEQNIKDSGILQRPPNVVQMDDKMRGVAAEKILEAKKAGGVVDWDSPLGKVKVYPDSNMDTIENYIFAERMDSAIGSIADMAQSGISKDIGNVTQEIASWFLAGKAGKLIKYAPGFEKAMKIAAENPAKAKFAKWLSGLAGNVGVTAGATYVGGMGPESEKKQKAVLAAIATGTMHTGLSAASKGASIGRKTIGNLLEKQAKGNLQKTVSAIKNAKTHADLPKNIKNKIAANEFPEYKKLVVQHDGVVNAVHNDVADLAANTGINARALEGFRQVFKNKDNPQAQRIISNLNTAELIHTGRTLEEARVESALMSSLGEANTTKGVKSIDAPLKQHGKVFKTTGEVDLGKHGVLIDKYRDLFGNPEQLLIALRRDHPEFANNFEARLRLPIYQPADFYFSRSVDLLNSTLKVSKENIHSFSEKLGGAQPTLSNLAKRTELRSEGEIQTNIQTLKSRIEQHKLMANEISSKINKQVEAVSKRPEVAAVTSEASGVNEAIKYLKNFADDVANGQHISKTYGNRAIEAMRATGADTGNLSAQIRDYQINEYKHGRTNMQLSDLVATHENLNPNEFMRKRGKFVNTNADRVANRIMAVADSADNLRYVKETYFRDWEVDPTIEAHISSAITDKMPSWDSVQPEIDSLNGVLLAGKDTLLPQQKRDTVKFIDALKSYEKDIQRYQTGMDAIHDPTNDVATLLSSLRNNLDQVRNPVIARELRTEIDKLKPNYLNYLEAKRADLSLNEQESMWNYLTGDAYSRLKEGAVNFDIVNENTASSMMKALNHLGRDTIDAYSEIYEIAHGQKLDKNIFHSFFCTPVNGFDENTAFLSANFVKALNEKKAVLDAAKSRWASIKIGTQSFDTMEETLARKLHLSAGPLMSYFVNDTRRAKKIIQEKMLIVQRDLEQLKAYPHMENPVLIDMIKKHFVVSGYNPGKNIANFKINGAYELTDFGKFADKVFNDPDLMLELQAAASGKTPGGLASLQTKLADIAVNGGWTKHDVIKGQTDLTHAQDWANYLTNYWNFFEHGNASDMWNHMKEFSAYYSKIDAELLTMDTATMVAQNKEYSKFSEISCIPKVHRDHRINNARSHVNNNIYNHPFGSGFEELRINHMFGTSETAVAEGAENFRLDNVKHPLDNLNSKVWASIISAETAHARAGLEAYAVGAKQLGFDLHADWIARNSKIFSSDDAVIENVQLSSLIREINNPKNFIGRVPVIPQIVSLANDTITSWVRPFNSLMSMTGVMKNNAQAATWSLAVSNKSAAKIFHALTAEYKMAYMTPFYDNKGMIRSDAVRKMIVKDPYIWDIGNQVIKGYEDVQYNAAMGAAMQFAAMGRTYGGSIAEGSGARNYFEKGIIKMSKKELEAASTFNAFVSRNTKEYSELMHSRSVINQGMVLGQAVIEALESGNRKEAYRLINSVFPTKASSVSEWHLQNFEKNMADGEIRDGLVSFLPAYADENTGRFGRITQPEYVQTVAKYIPGVGLFYSASNMWAWKYLSLLKSGLDKASQERAKFAMGAITIAGFSALSSAWYQVSTKGLPGPVADAVLTDEQKQKMANTGDTYSFSTMVSKGVANGFISGDKSKYAGTRTLLDAENIEYDDAINWEDKDTLEKLGSLKLKINYPNIETVKSFALEMLGFSSGSRKISGMQIPIFGYEAERLQKTMSKSWDSFKFYHEVPEHKLGDPSDSVQAEDIKEMEDNQPELLQKWLNNPDDPAVLDSLREIYSAKKALAFGRVLDNMLEIGPLGFTSDIFSNITTSILAFKTVWGALGYSDTAITMDKIMSTLESVSSSGAASNMQGEPITKKGIISPREQQEQLSPYPMQKLHKKVYESLGWGEGLTGKSEYEDYRTFMDNIAASMIKHDIWDPEYAAMLQEANRKEADIIYGVSRKELEQKQAVSKFNIFPTSEKDKKAQELREAGKHLLDPGTKKIKQPSK